jgi:starvation-inducible outer membrane lipoprotein
LIGAWGCFLFYFKGFVMNFRLVSLVASIALLSGCIAPIALTPESSSVQFVSEKPQDCKYVGEAVGSQGNFFTGDLTKNADLVQGARNDLRNKAAKLGGNTVHIQGGDNVTNLKGGSLDTSLIVGEVYSCKTSKN